MRRNNLQHFFILAGLVLLSSCANTGTPSGGPKDTTPPRLIRSLPLGNQVNFNKNRVELFFDEIVALENPSEKVIVSPPQKTQPTVKAYGNKISVLFSDSLKPNTTYTIDFTDGITDYNEKNKFGDYAFSFSTGDKIDSLAVSGTLIDASNLNPVSGVLVGVHSNLDDSTFVKVPFRRISKTSQNGFFSVKGLSNQQFRVFALADKNNDYRFDQPGEPIAYHDEIVKPYTEPCQKSDTIWKDSVTVDTVKVRTITCYKPDNIILKYFAEDFGRQYLSKRERPSREKIVLGFGYKSKTLPKVKLINADVVNWYQLEKNPTNDTLTYWITDTLVTKMDTLRLAVDYLKSDSLNHLVPQTDTIKLISRAIRPKSDASKEKKNKDVPDVPLVTHLAVKTELQKTMDIYCKPIFQWETPIREVKGNPWHLYKYNKNDSIWEKEAFTFDKDSVNLRDYILQAKWNFGEEYKFELDSGMVVGLYGRSNNKYSQNFKIKEEEEYSRLIVTVQGINGPGYAELVDKTDKVIYRKKMEKGVADFQYLAPGSYYIRAVEDKNGNFQWDTGDYAKKQQPENVYYNPRIMNLRANWDVEETWNVFEYPILEQKANELKPKNNNKKQI